MNASGLDGTPRLAQLAIDEGMIRPDQLQKCLGLQAQTEQPIGQLFVEFGHLNAAQVEQLRARVRLELGDHPAISRRAQIMSRQVIESNLVSSPDLFEAHRVYALQRAEGRPVALTTLLGELKLVTHFQQLKLETQSATIMTCPSRCRLYRVEGYSEGYRVRCLRCREPLELTTADVDTPDDAFEDLFFDRQRADDLNRYGVALTQAGHCTRQQVMEAARIQATALPHERIGQVLVGMGVIDAEILTAIDDELAAADLDRELRRRVKLERMAFGEIALKLGYVNIPLLKRALSRQLAARKSGEGRMLGHVMLEERMLTPYQLLQVLESQGRRIMTCQDCGKFYNARLDARPPQCPEGGQILMPAQATGEERIAADLAPGQKPSKKRRRRLEERVARPFARLEEAAKIGRETRALRAAKLAGPTPKAAPLTNDAPADSALTEPTVTASPAAQPAPGAEPVALEATAITAHAPTEPELPQELDLTEARLLVDGLHAATPDASILPPSIQPDPEPVTDESWRSKPRFEVEGQDPFQLEEAAPIGALFDDFEPVLPDDTVDDSPDDVLPEWVDEETQALRDGLLVFNEHVAVKFHCKVCNKKLRQEIGQLQKARCPRCKERLERPEPLAANVVEIRCCDKVVKGELARCPECKKPVYRRKALAGKSRSITKPTDAPKEAPGAVESFGDESSLIPAAQLQQSEVQHADRLDSARKRLRDLYAEIGAEVDREEAEDPSKRSDALKVGLGKGAPPSLMELNRATAQGGKAVKAHKLGSAKEQQVGRSLRVAGAILATLLVIGGSVGVVALTRKPNLQASNEEASSVSSVEPGTQIELSDLSAGDQIRLQGEVPWGEENVSLTESRQGFIVKTADGKTWWVIDEQGAWSGAALKNRVVPAGKGVPFYLELEGRLVSNPPMAVPPGQKPIWCLVLTSRWQRKPEAVGPAFEVLARKKQDPK